MQKIILRGINGIEKSAFSDSEHRLCLQASGGEKEIVFENCTNEFDIYQNELGKIHAALQDTDGNLIYLLCSENNWLNFTLLKSKNSECKFSSIKLFDTNGSINLFYVLKHGEGYLLVQHKVDLHNPQKPKVLDYIKNGKYSAFSDSKGNINILYKNSADKFFCFSYNAMSGKYTPQNIEIDEKVEEFCGVSSNGDIYISYIQRKKSHYSVIFYSLKTGEKKTIGFGTDSAAVPYMYCRGESIVVAWKERYSCYKCSTCDFGKTFSKTGFLGNNAINTIIKDCLSNIEYA